MDCCAVIRDIREDRCALVQHVNQYELVFEACLAHARHVQRRCDVTPAAIQVREQ